MEQNNLTHVQTLLNTLKQFNGCKISLTFNYDDSNDPVFSVCYQNHSFEITYLKEDIVERYDDIETTLLVIDQTLHIGNL